MNWLNWNYALVNDKVRSLNGKVNFWYFLQITVRVARLLPCSGTSYYWIHQACNFKSPFRSDRVSDETHQPRSARSSSARFPVDFYMWGKNMICHYKARISALQGRSAWFELCTAYGACLPPLGHTAPVLCMCEESLSSEPLDEHFGWASMIAVSFKCRCQILRRVNKGTVSVVFIPRYTLYAALPGARTRSCMIFGRLRRAFRRRAGSPDLMERSGMNQLWSSNLAPLFWNVLAWSPGQKRRTEVSLARPPFINI